MTGRTEVGLRTRDWRRVLVLLCCLEKRIIATRDNIERLLPNSPARSIYATFAQPGVPRYLVATQRARYSASGIGSMSASSNGS